MVATAARGDALVQGRIKHASRPALGSSSRSAEGRVKDPVVSDVSAHPSSSIVASRAVEGRLTDLVALLAKGAADFSLAIEEISQAERLSPSTRAAVTSIKSYAQAIAELAGSVASDGAPKPQAIALPQAGSIEHPSTVRARRPSNKAFDFLLLEALHVRPRLTVPVGLGDLKLIAQAFDPAVKTASLVAKLNRWKNDDKFLEWSSHEDMHLTTRGIARRAELLPLARKTGRLDAVNEAILSVLGVRSSY